MARPEIPDAQKRSYRIPSARLTEAENELFLGLVMQSGMTKAQFIRHAILNKKNQSHSKERL